MKRLAGRLPATRWRWVLFSMLGLSVAAACSDDDASSAKGPSGVGGVGGVGGEGEGEGGGAPASGNSSGGTGPIAMAGAAGAESAGEGGVGGTPYVATLGEQCTTCAASECSDTLQTCGESAECTAWLACLTACDTGECATACDDAHVDAARVYADVYDCLCTSCEDDCSGAGACEKKTCVDDNPLPVNEGIPATLAETGLYVSFDGAGGAGGAGGATAVDVAMPLEIASYVRTYEPKYPLWADGATKERYVYIPKCSTIDTSDMDHWKFPVGTRFWKTFLVDNKRIETRVLERFGPSETDWTYAAYQWDPNKLDDPRAAVSVPDGFVAPNLEHDIPAMGQCTNCHTKVSERVLGFSAFQLSHPASGSDLSIKELSELGWLTNPAPQGFDVPGTGLQQAALGYLHGNCGGCHNQGQTLPSPDSPLVLRLQVGKAYAAQDAVLTSVGIDVVSANAAIAGKRRIEPMDALNSGLLIRMQARGSGLQMPPLNTNSTKVPDTDGGVKAVTDWIGSLPVP